MSSQLLHHGELNRRGFLGGAALVSGGGASAASLLVLGGGATASDADLSSVAGTKFYADGRVHPFAGNTIVCHLPQQGPDSGCFNALLDVYRDAPNHAFMRKVALLPPSSYHMTVFSCTTDSDRGVTSWPSGLSRDATMAECDRFIGDRLRSFTLQTTLPICMRVDPQEPPPGEAPLKIRLVGADSDEERKLRALRDRLSSYLGIRGGAHDFYYFHISLGYLIQPLTDDEQHSYRSTLAAWRKSLMEASPKIVLGAPEFCTFADMFAYHRMIYLAG